jgi:transcriptional regulator with XRE-family HTH domain
MAKSTHTPQYAALRAHLAQLRTTAGLSQRQLATALRVPHSWVAKVESGERRLDLVEFAWFCTACNASPAREAATLFADHAPPARPSSRRARR